MSICCAGADSLACALITRLVSAWLFSSGWCSQLTAQIVALFFPRSGNPNHILPHPRSLFISQVFFFRKHAVGLFERILWVFLVLFLTSCGNPGVLVPTKHLTVTRLSAGNPGTSQKPLKAHFCVSKVVYEKRMKPCCVLPDLLLKLVMGAERQQQPERGVRRGTAQWCQGWVQWRSPW